MTTALSAGLAIKAMLDASPAAGMATKIFPICAEEAELPYIAYRRSGLTAEAVNNGASADTATIEVNCYARTYEESVALAEAVREALDGRRAVQTPFLRVRRCLLADAAEYWDADAYLQKLTFLIKL